MARLTTATTARLLAGAATMLLLLSLACGASSTVRLPEVPAEYLRDIRSDGTQSSTLEMVEMVKSLEPHDVDRQCRCSAQMIARLHKATPAQKKRWTTAICATLKAHNKRDVERGMTPCMACGNQCTAGRFQEGEKRWQRLRAKGDKKEVRHEVDFVMNECAAECKANLMCPTDGHALTMQERLKEAFVMEKCSTCGNNCITGVIERRPRQFSGASVTAQQEKRRLAKWLEHCKVQCACIGDCVLPSGWGLGLRKCDSVMRHAVWTTRASVHWTAKGKRSASPGAPPVMPHRMSVWEKGEQSLAHGRSTHRHRDQWSVVRHSADAHGRHRHRHGRHHHHHHHRRRRRRRQGDADGASKKKKRRPRHSKRRTSSHSAKRRRHHPHRRRRHSDDTDDADDADDADVHHRTDGDEYKLSEMPHAHDGAPTRKSSKSAANQVHQQHTGAHSDAMHAVDDDDAQHAHHEHVEHVGHALPTPVVAYHMFHRPHAADGGSSAPLLHDSHVDDDGDDVHDVIMASAFAEPHHTLA